MADETNICLEGNENELLHIFYEFHIFIYLLITDFKNSQELSNILVDARRLHSRTIMDFFSDIKKADDIIVTDIVKDNVVSSYLFDKEKYSDVRKMINKATAHLTEASCQKDFFPDELEKKFEKFYFELVKKIVDFTENIDKIINDNLKAKLQDSDVQNLIGKFLRKAKEIIENNKRLE